MQDLIATRPKRFVLYAQIPCRICAMSDHLGNKRSPARLLPILLAGLACSLTACPKGPRPYTEADESDSPAPASSVSYFQDVTATSGVHFTYVNGEEADHYAILESLGGGVALLDYDGDGLLDIFVTGGGTFGGPARDQIRGRPSKLYKNLGGWKFKDVTAEVFPNAPLFYTHGCAVADYDCDGWPDLLVTGYGQLALFHNESDGKGGRRFVEVTQKAGLHDNLWSTSAAWADFDGDGYPDLYVCHYLDWSLTNNPRCGGDNPKVPRDICPPKNFHGQPPVLYRNNRNGTFTEVSQEAGLRIETAGANMALGVLAVDVNDDARPDVYVVSDTADNYLYLNRSQPGQIRFDEQGLTAGVARSGVGIPDGSMGVDAADYDGSGRPSLFVTTFEHERHALFHNESRDGKVRFEYATWGSGIASIGAGYVGFGTGFLDVTNNGWEDLVTANGHVRRHATRCPLRQKPVLFRNQGGQPGKLRFLDATDQGGLYFREPHRGRGLAIGDLDNNGRPDLVISQLNEPVVLLRNEPLGLGAAANNHWLGIELRGRNNREIAGAKLVVEVGKGRLTRFAKGGGSYLSSGDRRLLFGLAEKGSVGRVSVAWPWGKTQHWHGLPVDRYWRLVEGEAAAQEPGASRSPLRAR
jgi:hypothetical protein